MYPGDDEIGRGRKCQAYSSDLYHCKRRRVRPMQDMTLYSAIREWETERVGGLKVELKEKYLSALKEELTELKQEFENLPATEDNASKRWRLNADVMQTEWRVSYCMNLVSK
mmetsp:Transcript_1938/g.4314  ORF Transcript_1938/g.4314 Transcript_1938/m.4314 type:complete len:112 (-) Transcript_1938:32-367(-)